MLKLEPLDNYKGQVMKMEEMHAIKGGKCVETGAGTRTLPDGSKMSYCKDTKDGTTETWCTDEVKTSCGCGGVN